jgi:hypothetical protein
VDELSALGGGELAEILPSFPVVTDQMAGALTVAGQWRIFTAFPNILAIVM